MPPDRLEQDFDNSIIISKAELRAQIAFDLCIFYLYDKKYDLARQKAKECQENLNNLKKEYADKQIDDKDEANRFLFCTFTDDELNGCLLACGLHENENIGLLHRLNESIMKNYEVSLVCNYLIHLEIFQNKIKHFFLISLGYHNHFRRRQY